MLLPAEKTDEATCVKWLIGSNDRVNLVSQGGLEMRPDHLMAYLNGAIPPL